MLIENLTGFKILTKNGFEPFTGVQVKSATNIVDIRMNDGSSITTTLTHRLFHHGKPILAQSVKPSMWLDGYPLKKRVVSITLLDEDESVFDIVGTASNTFIVNGVQSHNCDFISSDPLLIDSMKAENLKASQPITVNHGIQIWKKFEPSATQPAATPEFTGYENFNNDWKRDYSGSRQAEAQRNYDRQCIMTVDPSKGVGEDFTVIEVFSYPKLEQMMEFRSNESRTGEVYKLLKYLWKKAREAGYEVLFTVENNGVGEGLITLFENDDELPDNVELISDGGKSLGLNTNGPSKSQACKIFKEFVESDKITFHSADIIREIKTYVMSKGSYAAQPGSTDDCIAAVLLVCRVVKLMSLYDTDAYQKLFEVGELEDEDEYGGEDDDDYDEMPIVF